MLARGNYLLLIFFWFLRSKACHANIANFVSSWKPNISELPFS